MVTPVIAGQYIRVVNETTNIVTEISIRNEKGSFDFGFGTKNPNTSAGYEGPMRIATTDRCTVTWLDSSQQSHTNVVQMSTHALISTHPDMLFRIRNDGTVTIEKFKW